MREDVFFLPGGNLPAPQKKSKKRPNFPKIDYCAIFKMNKKNCKKYYAKEKICKNILENIFVGYTFEKVRPAFLINPNTNRPLELDLYNEHLNFAVEYNGAQHRKPHYFNGYGEKLRDQKNRDKIKKELCKKKGIKLLVIESEDVEEICELIEEYIFEAFPELFPHLLFSV